MGTYQKYSVQHILPKSVISQRCVKAIYKAKLSKEFENEITIFISRNILPDCGKVPSCCLKLHILRIARKLGISSSRISTLKNMFKSEINHNNYYLDAGKLIKV